MTNALVSIRLPQDDKERWEMIAASAGLSVSEYVRQTVDACVDQLIADHGVEEIQRLAQQQVEQKAQSERDRLASIARVMAKKASASIEPNGGADEAANADAPDGAGVTRRRRSTVGRPKN